MKMGTPVHQLFRRILSPNSLSKTVLKSPKSPLIKSPTTNLKPPSSQSFIKSLKFPNSPTGGVNQRKCDSDLGIAVLPIHENQNNYDFKNNNFKCDLFGSNRRDFEKLNIPKNDGIPFVNTPVRCKILSSGLRAKNWPILGKGTFGTVVQCIYKGELVAMKVVPNRKYSHTTFREANVINLQHPNIVHTICVISEPTDNFGIILMQDCKTLNMQYLLEDCNFEISVLRILRWALAVSEGLNFCHLNRILHLDVKPKNILVGEDDVCKLCDFGNSVNLNSQEQVEDLFLGTVVYTAPELFRGQKPKFSSDVYSLAITMWQMESRKMPYTEIDNKDTVIYEVVKKCLRPIVFPETVSPFTNVYTKCWHPNESMRPSLKHVIEELNILLGEI